MSKESFTVALQEKKSQGLGFNQAAVEVWALELKTRTLSVDKSTSYLLSTFITALLEVFTGITPDQLAAILKELSFTDEETATGIRDGIREYGQDVSAVDLGAALLTEAAFPQTTKERMQILLELCQYSDEEIAQALKILYPIIFVVEAKKGWQDTGIILSATELALIEYVSGTWNISPDVRGCGPLGTTRFIAKDGYTLPGKPEGALVGRVGRSSFMVGKRAETEANLTGKLELCPNDDLDSRYGRGLADNSGSISVKISVMLR